MRDIKEAGHGARREEDWKGDRDQGVGSLSLPVCPTLKANTWEKEQLTASLPAQFQVQGQHTHSL